MPSGRLVTGLNEGNGIRALDWEGDMPSRQGTGGVWSGGSVWRGRRSKGKRYAGESRLIPPKGSYRRGGLAPRCRLVTSWGWRRSQGLGCSPIKGARELGSERRETVRSLSIVGVGVLRGAATSTRGPWLTYLRFTGCAATCTAGYPRRVRISAESI